MSSQVDEVNGALQKLGLDPIVSLSDKDKRARSMALAYDKVRQSELRAHNWKFAEVDAPGGLAALTVSGSDNWLYEYPLPNDCLRVLSLGMNRQSIGGILYRTGFEQMYTIKGKSLFSNIASPCPLTYTSDVTDTTLFDACFSDMFQCKLAYQTCIHLTQNQTLKSDIAKEYKRALNQALLAGSVELPPQGIADDSYTLSRL